MDPLFKKSQQFNKLRILAAIMNLKKENPATSFFLEPSKNHRSNLRLLPIETGEKKTKEKNRPHKTTIDIDLCRSPPSWGEI